MFLWDRALPVDLQLLDVLLPRFLGERAVAEALDKQVKQLQKGWNGERKLDYHLEALPDAFRVLPDVTLTVGSADFQMDTLIVTDECLFIIDSKSVEGEITFDTRFRQFHQLLAGQRTEMTYPITQVERLKAMFIRWLDHMNLHGLPIYYFISIAENSTSIQVIGDENKVRNVVGYAEMMPIMVQMKHEQIAGKFPANRVAAKKIIHAVEMHRKPFSTDLLRQYRIQKSHVKPGVKCAGCSGTVMMTYYYGMWICPSCKTTDRHAGARALSDYTLLFGNAITNEEARHFLQLEDRKTVRRILKRSNFVRRRGSLIWYRP